MTGPTSWLRFSALISAGAFGVHQLRYLAAYGEDARAALHHSGHGYLSAVEPLIGLALAFGLSHVVWRAAQGTAGRSLPSRRHLAVLFGASLLAIYVGQELIEGALAPGHASGLQGVFGAGGWIAVPLSFVIGGLLSLGVRAAARLAEKVSFDGAVAFRWPSLDAVVEVRACADARAVAPIARNLAGRGPPLLLTT